MSSLDQRDFLKLSTSLLAEARLEKREDLLTTHEQNFSQPASVFAAKWLRHTSNPLYRAPAKLMLRLFSPKTSTASLN